LQLTGRIKELINRGGEKISPLEIDAALLSLDEVSEAVCFGVEDAKYGEVSFGLFLHAMVVLIRGISRLCGLVWCSKVAKRATPRPKVVSRRH